MARRVRPVIVPAQILSVLFHYERRVGWVAHCLEYHLVTSAKTLDGAKAAVVEATQMALADDRADGIDSRSRARAPHARWSVWQRIRAEGHPLSSFGSETSRRQLLLAAQMRLHISTPGALKSEFAPEWLTQALLAA